MEHLSSCRVALVYIYPIVGESKWDDAARRFVSTYQQYPPLAEHALHVVFNGSAPDSENIAVFEGLEARFHAHDNTGWDIGAYQRMAGELDCDIIVCLGASSYFKRAGWLRRIVDVFLEHGHGLYGASASYEVTHHIRTAGFWCNPELIRAYPTTVRVFEERYAFEHGAESITSLAKAQGLTCLLVTWDSVYSESEWRVPFDTFGRGDQSNALMYDGRFDQYGARTPVSRMWYSGRGDGLPLVSPPVPFENVWALRSGMKTSKLQRLLLRLLQPFADSQDELNAHNAEMFEALVHQLDWQYDRIRQLDRSHDSNETAG